MMYSNESPSSSIRRQLGQALFPSVSERSYLPRFIKRPKKRPPGQTCSADLIIPKNVLDAETRRNGPNVKDIPGVS